MWTKKERFEAVLNHELADRPPVSAWRHFTENEHSGADLFVETMLKWQNTYDWDYVKLQPRASYGVRFIRGKKNGRRNFLIFALERGE